MNGRPAVHSAAPILLALCLICALDNGFEHAHGDLNTTAPHWIAARLIHLFGSSIWPCFQAERKMSDPRWANMAESCPATGWWCAAQPRGAHHSRAHRIFSEFLHRIWRKSRNLCMFVRRDVPNLHTTVQSANRCQWPIFTYQFYLVNL